MKYFPLLRSLTMAVCGLATAPACLASGIALPSAAGFDFMLFTAKGYLGVLLGDVDSERATALHLKDTHGAEVTMIDHDAPAGKAGLRVHDVILQIDGRSFDTAAQMRKRLREMPSGRTVAFLISRDGARMDMIVELCDQAKLQEQVWEQHRSAPDAPYPSPKPPVKTVKTFLPRPAAGPGFLANVLPKSLYVGADVNPVRTQLADYFGVVSGTGLLVENVDSQSPASRAGMKAGDVIVQVEAQPMRSRSDWFKSIRRHRGEQVQVTVMRNKQQQILTMTAGKAKKG